VRQDTDGLVAYPRLGIRTLPNLPKPRFSSIFSVVMMLVVAAATLPMAIGAPGNAEASWTTTVETDALNLRDAPSTKAEVITEMYWGDEVEILDGPVHGHWYQVAYGDLTGWAYGKYLAVDGGVGGDGSGGERWIDVDRTSQRVTLYEGDILFASYWGAMGWDQSDDGYYATANGTYYVYEKYADLSWSEYGKVFFNDWVGFDPDRANGFHSYSRDGDGNLLPGGDGPTGGCVALDPSYADAVYAFAQVGMRVEVHW